MHTVTVCRKMLETGGALGGGGEANPYICDFEMTNYDTRKIKIGGPKFICTYIGIACKSVYIATYSIIKKALCHCQSMHGRKCSFCSGRRNSGIVRVMCRS